mmetsp:Transcript_7897/g.11711  ORF Transcript_7897/g.11711 Transcript_7897/m.11711 type:complete len:569 (+) Transcript_7897:108-1814(+)
MINPFETNDRRWARQNFPTYNTETIYGIKKTNKNWGLEEDYDKENKHTHLENYTMKQKSFKHHSHHVEKLQELNQEHNEQQGKKPLLTITGENSLILTPIKKENQANHGYSMQGKQFLSPQQRETKGNDMPQFTPIGKHKQHKNSLMMQHELTPILKRSRDMEHPPSTIKKVTINETPTVKKYSPQETIQSPPLSAIKGRAEPTTEVDSQHFIYAEHMGTPITPFVTRRRHEDELMTDDGEEDEHHSNIFEMTIGTRAAVENKEFNLDEFHKYRDVEESEHQEFMEEDLSYFENREETKLSESIVLEKENKHQVLYAIENDQIINHENKTTRCTQTMLTIAPHLSIKISIVDPNEEDTPKQPQFQSPPSTAHMSAIRPSSTSYDSHYASNYISPSRVSPPTSHRSSRPSSIMSPISTSPRSPNTSEIKFMGGGMASHFKSKKTPRVPKDMGPPPSTLKIRNERTPFVFSSPNLSLIPGGSGGGSDHRGLYGNDLSPSHHSFSASPIRPTTAISPIKEAPFCSPLKDKKKVYGSSNFSTHRLTAPSMFPLASTPLSPHNYAYMRSRFQK